MPESGLPTAVEQFISENIRSLEHLEVLLALAAEPEKKWTGAEVFAKVRSSEASVSDRLEDLRGRGLVDKEGELYQFAPKDPRMRATIEELGKAYKERSLRVIEAVYSDRGRAVQELSEAFRFRKRRKDG